jgi:hypothetical protein
VGGTGGSPAGSGLGTGTDVTQRYPAAHGPATAPPVQYDPAGHAGHWRGSARPVPFPYVPGGHAVGAAVAGGQ